MHRSICVFCGSSDGTVAAFHDAAAATGRAVAARGGRVVYGGAAVGLMGRVADAALAAGGEVIGVIPEIFGSKEIAHAGLTELHVVDTMHTRKLHMATLADAFVALPGGLGTLEEILEALTWTQIGIHDKPCGLLNVDGFYDPLLQLLDHATESGLVRPSHRASVIAAATIDELLVALDQWTRLPEEKWA